MLTGAATLVQAQIDHARTVPVNHRFGWSLSVGGIASLEAGAGGTGGMLLRLVVVVLQMQEGLYVILVSPLSGDGGSVDTADSHGWW